MSALRMIPGISACTRTSDEVEVKVACVTRGKFCCTCQFRSSISNCTPGKSLRKKLQVDLPCFKSPKAASWSVHDVRAQLQTSEKAQVENTRIQKLELLRKGMMGEHPDEAALREIATLDLNYLTSAAAEVRDRANNGNIVTFSPKVFIPLTRVCRDVCGYCTFSLGPRPDEPVYMTIEEVLKIARAGAAAGCSEALFTLGDKPELLYQQAKSELAAMGFATTIDFVAEAARVVLEETGLLPHINAGAMGRGDVAKLRQVSVSQGLMLESTSERLMEPGGPHYNCPDKHPAARLATIAAAGEERVPFTSGLLLGIGETRDERLDSLFALRELHQKYGHIQELIIQNFRAKKKTRMANAPEPALEELVWTVAMARLVFGCEMNIQAPPNLTPASQIGGDRSWRAMIESGINDWGGISPVTIDWVNPEAPWPHLEALAEATSGAGKVLLPRLPVYPSFLRHASNWMEPSVMKWVLANSNSMGYARAETWSPGISRDETQSAGLEQRRVFVDSDGTVKNPRARSRGKVSPEVTELVQRAEAGEQLNETDVTKLLEAVGPDFAHIRDAADALRKRVSGEEVTYVVNRNINYTNVCSYRCQFCAFSKGRTSEELRGKPYVLSLEEIARRSAEAWERGATEVCMQGGIHPEYTGETYLEILKAVKSAAPNIHIHAFSPLEVFQGASTLGISLREFLIELKDAGLGSLPGTAAEVLDDEVRRVLCPDKINTQQWLEIVETAHGVGLRTTSTIMFGHLDHPYHWARHLLRLRKLQERTGGFTEFVPLPFVHMEAPVFLKGRARKGPTLRDCLMMHSVARLVLYPFITNIQASWVKMGPGGVKTLLASGCNDMGGSLMNESITRAAGATYGEELPPAEMEEVILSVGRKPRQRTTLYGEPPAEQVQKSFVASPLVPVR